MLIIINLQPSVQVTGEVYINKTSINITSQAPHSTMKADDY